MLQHCNVNVYRSFNVDESADRESYVHNKDVDGKRSSSNLPLTGRSPASTPIAQLAQPIQLYEHPAQLSALLKSFIDIKCNKYASICKFCADNVDIWNQDIKPLNVAARQLLLKGHKEVARQAAHRYLLWNSCMRHEDVRKRLQILDALSKSPVGRRQFEERVDEYLDNLLIAPKQSQTPVSKAVATSVKRDHGDEDDGSVGNDDEGEEEEEDGEEDDEEEQEEDDHIVSGHDKGGDVEAQHDGDEAEHEDSQDDGEGYNRDKHYRNRQRSSASSQNPPFTTSRTPLPYKQLKKGWNPSAIPNENQNIGNMSPPAPPSPLAQRSRRESAAFSVGSASYDRRGQWGPSLADVDSMSREMPVHVSGGGIPETVWEKVDEDIRHDIDDSYKVYRGKHWIDKVFCPGSVIAVFWHESYGNQNLPPKLAALPQKLQSAVKVGPGWITECKGETIFSHVKRWIITQQRPAFSIGIPISSYGGKGLTMKNLPQTELMAHTIVYALGKQPILLKDEIKPEKGPICVQITCDDSSQTLTKSSRLYYAKPQSIDHNIKVKHLGYVVRQHQDRLLEDFRQELFRDPNTTLNSSTHVKTPAPGRVSM